MAAKRKSNDQPGNEIKVGDEKPYQVGDGRRPVERQFKPGQYGKPKGRPKGRKNLRTMFVEALNKKVKLRDKNGTRTVSKLEAMIEVNINKAIAGDGPTFARI